MAEEHREQQREAEREVLNNAINDIHEGTDGKVNIELSNAQAGTILDAPGYPIVWGVLVKGERPDSPGWTLDAPFNEVLCYLNGFQTALMLLSALMLLEEQDEEMNPC